MKKLILLISVLFCFYTAQAQGDLQFNRVVYIEADLDTSFQGPGSFQAEKIINLNIPQGKVWKIESINGNSTGGSTRLNNLRITDGNTTYQRDNFPIWLPAGNHEFSVKYGGNSQSSSVIYVNKYSVLSALEFNIIQ